jgi:DNA segregation ATPase FtsK/SpoIIIE-like protein
MVTDQMRANMKFRICLRVETAEDSKELLKRDDAARLPPLGGRGYIQVGSGQLSELQAAWAGADYTDSPPDPVYPTDEIVKVLGLPEGSKPGLMIDWIVGALAAEAERQEVPQQRKPWPDPLPMTLGLNERVDITYLKTDRSTRAQTLLINPDVDTWVSNKKADPLWKPWEWVSPLPLKADLGLVDNPFDAEQQLLSLDISSDPIAIFGAAGRGKTTLLKSLIISLAAARSPAELNIFALDFGRGGLKGIANLPHVGATIDASQPQRVEQLFRLIHGQMKERQERLSAYASLEDYNAQKKDEPDAMFPAILIVIDNFAEFTESYEYLVPDLISLVRDGRQLGIYYVVTSGQVGDLGGKLFNSFSRRVTFTMSDPSVYPDLVGRGALSLDDVPGRGLINIEGQPLEFHVAMPVIEGEKDPYAVLAERMEKAWTSIGGKRPAAELPRSLTFLDMYSIMLGKRVDRIGDIPITDFWKDSMKPENQEWLRSSLGLISSREVRDLIFSAKAGGDGVHGMIAGTTGSGKSELLLTLVASMAMRYDPRIVNFVLVDFKGGAAFEPFKKLPHVVDIATNLQGNAVERIFIAMKAELDRRAKLLADARVGDLVEYRKKVIPKLKKGDKLPDTFPHLFIIVDEFAEMIMLNPEYKAQFESITRLGRAFGATLILATQRPAGMVTDQMRANMKFRICLRVETADDSKELLKRSDAATLPALGGRGYIQVGGGPLIELQAAWAGADYVDDGNDPTYKTAEMLDALDLNVDNQPGIMIDWIVGALGAEAKRQKIPRQLKPWPDPLPDVLPLDLPIDGSYLEGSKPGQEAVLDPLVARWMKYRSGRPLWKEVDWSNPIPMLANVGVIDNPYQSKQKLMSIDLASDPLIAFGAAGRGKTTFLKTLIVSLAASLSPEDLHIYVLDFGRGGLKPLRAMPHIGGIVDANEAERVERLMRMVRHIIDDRQQKLATYDSVEEYNAANPKDTLPAVLVVIDDVSEFKETYDEYLLDLVNLIRDGRSFGVYFALTGGVVGDAPSRLFSVLGQRVTFTQLDPTDYSMIVGRGWININDVPGRGLMVDTVDGKPQPLEFHTAVPGGDAAGETYRTLSQNMAKAWANYIEETPAAADKRASTIEVLAEAINLADVLPAMGKGAEPLAVPLGINDLDRLPTQIELQAKGPHWLVLGPPMTGKTTTLRSFVLALAHCYTPDRVAMVLVDPSDPARRFFTYGASEGNSLEDLPHVLATVTNAEELDQVVKRLHAEYSEPIQKVLKGKAKGYVAQDNKKRAIFVIMDHYDDVDLLNSSGLGTLGLSEVGKGQNLHIVIGGSLDITRDSSDKLRRRAESSRYTLVLQDYEAVRYMGVRGDLTVNKEIPAGRGFLVKAIQASMTQICLPFIETTNGKSPEEQLGGIIGGIKKKYRKKARWSYSSSDLSVLEAALSTVLGDSVSSSSGAVSFDSDAMAELERLMAEQAELESEVESVEIPEAGNFASVEVGAEKKKTTTRKRRSTKK